jgi:transposase
LPELGSLNRAEAAALLGVAPFNHDSGAMRGRRAIGGGRAPLRRALYCTTSAAIIWNTRRRSYYEHLIANGKVHKVAMVATSPAADAECHHQNQHALEIAVPGVKRRPSQAAHKSTGGTL